MISRYEFTGEFKKTLDEFKGCGICAVNAFANHNGSDVIHVFIRAPGVVIWNHFFRSTGCSMMMDDVPDYQKLSHEYIFNLGQNLLVGDDWSIEVEHMTPPDVQIVLEIESSINEG